MALAGYLMAFWAMRANSFAGRTIRVEPGQTVATSGPYGIVRHPMYSGIALVLLGMPLGLGSYVASPVFALAIVPLVYRLLNEEKVLRRDLRGYSEYCEHTHFRLVPGVW